MVKSRCGKVPLSCEEALRVVAAAHERARQLQIRVTVAVVDEGGLLLALGGRRAEAIARAAGPEQAVATATRDWKRASFS